METKTRSAESEAPLRGRALWEALQRFDLDGDAPMPFTKKLARDNRWSPEFAARVVAEYKKFVFLAMEAGHPVSPSDEVDQAWHLHLCYTRSYWDEMCAQVLGRPLHHGPTRGGAAESAKFHDWYQKTLDSYRQAFGHEPPSDIWPPTSVRSVTAASWRRVDVERHWVLKKPKKPAPGSPLAELRKLSQKREVVPFAPPVALAGALLAVCAVLLIAGDASGAWAHSLSGLNLFNWDGPSFLALFWSSCLAGAIAVALVRASFALPDDRSFPAQEPDAYHIARLSQESDLPTDAALASLQAARKIHIRPDGQIERLDTVPPANPWEREVWNALLAGHLSLRGVRNSVRDRLKYLDAGLQQMGLLVEPSLSARVQRISQSIPLVLLLIGACKIGVGMSRQKPVGFLILTCVAIGVVMLCSRKSCPRQSKRGRAFLEHLQARYTRDSLRSQSAAAGASSSMAVSGIAAMSLALWGYGELDALGMVEARAAMMPVASSGGGSSGGGCGGSGDGGGGGGGCGGGGCGGGCGGCGGG